MAERGLANGPKRAESMSQPKHSLLEEIGMRIKELRKSQGLSQLGLAQKAGLHRTYIADVERGMRNASVLTLLQVASGLGVTLRDLFAETQKAGRNEEHT